MDENENDEEDEDIADPVETPRTNACSVLLLLGGEKANLLCFLILIYRQRFSSCLQFKMSGLCAGEAADEGDKGVNAVSPRSKKRFATRFHQ